MVKFDNSVYFKCISNEDKILLNTLKLQQQLKTILNNYLISKDSFLTHLALRKYITDILGFYQILSYFTLLRQNEYINIHTVWLPVNLQTSVRICVYQTI